MGYLIFGLIALVVLVALYFVIRLAVSDGMQDAWKRREQNASKPGEWGPGSVASGRPGSMARGPRSSPGLAGFCAGMP